MNMQADFGDDEYIDKRLMVKPEPKGSEVVHTEFYCPECWHEVGRFDSKCKHCGYEMVKKIR